MGTLSKMFKENLEQDRPMSTSIEWLETEAKDAFDMADEGDCERALGRLTVIVADLALHGKGGRDNAR